jgi:GTPase involved in cell partitioning and DNA repair
MQNYQPTHGYGVVQTDSEQYLQQLRNTSTGSSPVHLKNTRFKDLLLEMEEQSKKHIEEINQIHEHYRFYMVKFKDLEEGIVTLKQDADFALENERKMRRELQRVKIQNEALLSRVNNSRKGKQAGKIIVSPKSTSQFKESEDYHSST